MLRTMMETFNAEKHDASFEAFVLDANERRDVNMEMLEACGDVGCDTEDSDYGDEHLDKLIDAIPETDIDEDSDLIEEGCVGNCTDEKGEKKKMTLDECTEAYIPPTEYD